MTASYRTEEEYHHEFVYAQIRHVSLANMSMGSTEQLQLTLRQAAGQIKLVGATREETLVATDHGNGSYAITVKDLSPYEAATIFIG